jgi:DNA-binding MarR family transcriptional regulator
MRTARREMGDEVMAPSKQQPARLTFKTYNRPLTAKQTEVLDCVKRNINTVKQISVVRGITQRTAADRLKALRRRGLVGFVGGEWKTVNHTEKGE